ncbi:MAG: beta-phosphoglucomutase [Steroidobacteraceae bacterium]
MQTQLDPAQRDTDDTLFALANGSLGIRGGFEEVAGAGGGCFMAAAYERHPIHYHERFPGYARHSDTRVPVADGRRILILLDGEPLDIDVCEWLDFERSLDLRRGLLLRRLRLRTPAGATLQIDSERFVALDQDLLMIRYRVTSIDWRGMLTLESSIVAGRRAAAQGDDPRIGAAGGEAMQCRYAETDENVGALAQCTRHSGIAVYCAQSHRLAGDGLRHAGIVTGEGSAGQFFQASITPGQTVELQKFVAYAAAGDVSTDTIDALSAATRQRLGNAVGSGYDALKAVHSGALAAFWDDACIDVPDDADASLALRFNLFHLLQSASRSPQHGTAAKGLTGEGYEGHCFWDTEVFVLPVMALTAPRIARAMLLFRHRQLDSARANARELNHTTGALYPWRTIAGAECSAHYPTGSAAYHINADIAWAIGLYYDATGDDTFLLEAGAEMLFETARIWPQVGHFDWLRGGFGIYGVTGPDEYSVLVDNNFYTNRMAQRHLQRAVRVWEWLQSEHSQSLQAIASRLALQQDEIDDWRRIAAAMRLPVDGQLDIYAQDDAFLHKPLWPYTDPAGRRPLLLHYHPLTLFRHQISKQADLVMALMMAGDDLDSQRKRRSFEHYEAVTTHDSTLSAAVHGIVASEVELHDKAWHYFNEALRIDLDNLHGNTTHGVHMAAMAGSWLGLVQGFAGLRIVDGTLCFRPSLPGRWGGYAFGLHWRGRRLRVQIDPGGTVYHLLDGDALDIMHEGAAVRLQPGGRLQLPFAPHGNAQPTFPRHCRALIFDLDGVLTDTARMHYLAWKRLADEIGVPFDEGTNRRLKGISRAQSLDILLERAGRDYDDAEKWLLMERKNGYYREAIAAFGVDDLFPGARRLLDGARRTGLRIALASASRNAPELLRRLGIDGCFDAVVDAAAITSPKPDPEIFLAAAQALGVSPADCIGIEDAAAGIAAIKAAGMAAIGIGDPEELRQADAVLASLRDLRLEAFVGTSADAHSSGRECAEGIA